MTTNSDKITDNKNFSQKNENFIEKIKKFKEEDGVSWKKIANKIYYAIEQNEEYNQHYRLNAVIDHEEDDVIRKFADALENAVKRNQKSTSLNSEKIPLKNICFLLEINQ